MTDASADILPLAADFPPARREQWLELVGRLLKGAPFDRKLVGRTYDGLTIQPLYERAPAEPVPAGRMPGTGWQLLQRIDHPEPAAANAEALHDRHNGATGLSLVFAGAIGAYGYGVAAGEDAIARTLEGIPLDAADLALELDAGAWAEDAGRAHRGAAQPARRAGRRSPYPFRLRPARHDGGERDGAGRLERNRGAIWRHASPSSRAPASRVHSRSRMVARSTMPAAPRRRSSASCWRSPPPICGHSRAVASGSMRRAA